MGRLIAGAPARKGRRARGERAAAARRAALTPEVENLH
jgi:hypothetical protein